MRIDILTLFPAMFSPLEQSMIGKAQAKGLLEINIIDIRDYSFDKHHTADDRLYGGGAGMVMKPEPIMAALEDIKGYDQAQVIITAPHGKPYRQAMAQELSQKDHIIIVCGHYEGIDQRVSELSAATTISLGDFILTGGEMAALAIADSIGRLIPGVLGHEQATIEESFSDGLLEYPQYTRPPVFRDMEVPAVLQSGDHAAIAKWRREQSLKRTYQNRPDLLTKAPLTTDDYQYLSQLKRDESRPFNLFVALVHYPVLNKKQQIINTSLTNLDLHDIARAAATFGLEKYYLVQPIESQKGLIDNLINHWQSGFGAKYNPARKQALDRVAILPYLADVVADIEAKYQTKPHIIASSALDGKGSIAYDDMRQLMAKQGGNYLLLLGTGWGLAPEIMAEANYRLRPIYGPTDYNHLSVRSAASIMFDRLLGE